MAAGAAVVRGALQTARVTPHLGIKALATEAGACKFSQAIHVFATSVTHAPVCRVSNAFVVLRVRSTPQLHIAFNLPGLQLGTAIGNLSTHQSAERTYCDPYLTVTLTQTRTLTLTLACPDHRRQPASADGTRKLGIALKRSLDSLFGSTLHLTSSAVHTTTLMHQMPSRLLNSRSRTRFYRNDNGCSKRM